LFAAMLDGGLRVYDPQGERLAVIDAMHQNTIYQLAFSADGRTLATASFDRTIKLWDTRDLMNI